jgi:hypothetical protein
MEHSKTTSPGKSPNRPVIDRFSGFLRVGDVGSLTGLAPIYAMIHVAGAVEP